MRYRVLGGVKGHPLGCNKPQRQGKPTPNSPRTGEPTVRRRVVGKCCSGGVPQQGGGSGRRWAPHPDSHLLLDPVAEVFLDELAAGAGAEGQVALQRLQGG